MLSQQNLSEAEDDYLSLVVDTQDKYEEYTSSPGYIIKKVWICLQAVIMTQFMIRGLIYYQRTIKGCTKVKWLIGFQGAQFIYLVVNEFVFHNMAGIYVNLLLCSYGHFLTFCIVTDWCTTTTDDNRHDCKMVYNRVMRIVFHIYALVLLICVFGARSCNEHLYPFAFCLLGTFILMN